MASEVLRARVDPEFARRVEAWARDHDTDVSETIRIALKRLVEDDERRQRVEETLRFMAEAKKAGVFEPPRPGESWKAGGFR